jgi:hypothetical protein
MRWQRLFADLQAEFEAAEAATARAEDGSRGRAEVGGLRLVDRLAGARGLALTLGCTGAGPVSGVLEDLGPDWLLLADGGRDVLVAAAAVRTVAGLVRTTGAADVDGPVRARLDLRRALRGLVRDRAAVQVVLDEGTALTGTLDRVGADFVEVAEHAVDEPRRASAVRGVRAVALAGVAVVRTLPPGGV